MSDIHSIRSRVSESLCSCPHASPRQTESVFIRAVLFSGAPRPKFSFQPIPAGSPSEIRAMNQKGFKAQESSGCTGGDLKGSDFLANERPA